MGCWKIAVADVHLADLAALQMTEAGVSIPDEFMSEIELERVMLAG